MKTAVRSLLTAAALLGGLAASSPARAESSSHSSSGLTGESETEHFTSELYFELGFNTRNPAGSSLTTWAPNLGFYTELDELFALSADWGLTALEVQNGLNQPGVKPLNPFVAVHLTPDAGALDLRVGLGIALPVAEANDAANLAPYTSARAVRGSWDPWLYEPDTVSFVVPLRAEYLAAEVIELAVEGAVWVQLDTAGGQERIGFQGAIEAATRVDLFRFGLRLQGVRPEDEVVRASIEPMADVQLGPVWLRGRLTLNLAAPDGFAFDTNGIWGAHLGLAYRF